MSNQAKIKLIKDTVIKSILSQTSDNLAKNSVSEQKTQALLRITELKLERILDNFDQADILPKKFLSQEEFESHLLTLIDLSKERLVEDVNLDKKH